MSFLFVSISLSFFLIAVLSCSELWANLFHFPSFLVAVLSCNKGVCHTVAIAIYIKKYLKAKEELWKLKYFTMQKYNLQKIL